MKIPLAPPDIGVLSEAITDPETFRRVASVLSPLDDKGRYLHWDQMRTRRAPDGLSREEWWLGTKLARRSSSRELPFESTGGETFSFCENEVLQEAVHRIDRHLNGRMLKDAPARTLGSFEQSLSESLLLEAISSSQLEGATTTSRVATEMLLTGRRPRDLSETMILNNHRALLLLRDLADEPLSVEAVLEIHRTLTEGTLAVAADEGRLQIPGDRRIGVYLEPDGVLLHQPPDAEELPERMELLCRFASGEVGAASLHPVVRAIITHFVLAYDHPFADGNGRTARTLFYWVLLHAGFPMAQYPSISSVISGAPIKYATSFLYVETDEFDLTYFILDQLNIIERALGKLLSTIGAREVEAKEVERLLGSPGRFNDRQIAVLRSALGGDDESFTIAAHRTLFRVTYETARSDLLKLTDLGLLDKRQTGKKFVFTAPNDLKGRLKRVK